jgi:tRNA pseudouridine38-40 synthase
MPRVALVLAFDGTRFAGWQAQRTGVRTVQGELEAALARITASERVVVEGSGRTDAGAHALGLVAHADLERVPERLERRLNGVLPEDVRVRGAVVVADAFHARKSARGKRYHYDLHVAREADVLRRHVTLLVSARLDVDAMREAARLLVGEHDFASFQTAGSSVKTTTRRVDRCDVIGDPPSVRIVVEGSGFLRHMVRAMVGTLLQVGHRRRPVVWAAQVLDARSRNAAGPNAPAHALVLDEVFYGEPWASMLQQACWRRERDTRLPAAASAWHGDEE